MLRHGVLTIRDSHIIASTLRYSNAGEMSRYTLGIRSVRFTWGIKVRSLGTRYTSLLFSLLIFLTFPRVGRKEEGGCLR